MTIDDKIEAARELLNTEIAKSNFLLTAKGVINISKKLDELLIERYKLQNKA